MRVARWVLFSAALLAAFQAWLWSEQQSLLGLAVAIGLALALVAAVSLPGTRYAVVLNHEWTLSRAPGESERRYRFKVAGAWLLVVALCVLGCVVLRDGVSSGVGGIALRVFGFVAALMALQSFLVGQFRPACGTPANAPLEHRP